MERTYRRSMAELWQILRQEMFKGTVISRSDLNLTDKQHLKWLAEKMRETVWAFSGNVAIV